MFTQQKANVFYELGFADGVSKEVILVAKTGPELPFDVSDVPVLFWDSFTEFEDELRKRVERILRRDEQESHLYFERWNGFSQSGNITRCVSGEFP